MTPAEIHSISLIAYVALGVAEGKAKFGEVHEGVDLANGFPPHLALRRE